MNNEQFNKLVKERFGQCEAILCKKADEYASDTDRLHNFKVAARVNQCSPEQALWGMYSKHLVSVMDMFQAPDRVTAEQIKEKIGDSINYHMLLEALLVERLGGGIII